MPIDITLVETHLFIRMYGVVTALDLAGYARDSELLEGSQPQTLDRITDLTAVEKFDVSQFDLFQLADRRKRRTYSRVIRSAIIATTPIQVGISRMFQGMSASPQLEYRIVKTLPEAIGWINSSPPTGTSGISANSPAG